jgi:hypothetical protein
VIRILKSAAEIETAQASLVVDFQRTAVRFEHANVGYQGGAEDVPLLWRPDVGIWGVFERWPLIQPNRYWNAFGIQDPSSGSSLSITCEINPPLEGGSRTTAGAFAQDTESGRTLLLHSGRIGGGRPGINMSLFWRNWPSELTVDAFDGRVRRMATVCRLGTSESVLEIANFVKQVAAMKAGPRV